MGGFPPLPFVGGGWGGGGGGGGGGVAYSTPKEAYAELIPAFQKTPAGKGVTFTQSYGASGDQSRAVEAGLPADVVAFSLAPDVTRLVKAGLVDANWNNGPYKGIVTDSVVVLAVRKGNPKNIKTWDDLTKPGVQVITPNPFTSGGARWNVMAAYGAQIEQGKSPAQAEDYLGTLFKNVAGAGQERARGAADVRRRQGRRADRLRERGDHRPAEGPVELDYVIPDQTILIENPVAVTKTGRREGGQGVRRLPLHAGGAEDLRREGLPPRRGGHAGADKFPTPAQLFTIDKFGGWTAVTTKFFDPQAGIVAEIEQSLGVSTASG